VVQQGGRPAGHPYLHPRRGAGPELLILHELAHAWDGHTLTDERRTAFLDWRGLHQWWGTEHEHWGEYGAEQAAETIVWGVIDRPIRASQIPPPYNNCGHLRTAYLMLTGRPPLHGYTDRSRRAESDDLERSSRIGSDPTIQVEVLQRT
jgi:hypothetical protein